MKWTGQRRSDLDSLTEIGDWYVTESMFWVVIPIENRLVPIRLPWSLTGDNKRWKLSGGFDKPTLSPSIGTRTANTSNFAFHGWFRDGELIEC